MTRMFSHEAATPASVVPETTAPPMAIESHVATLAAIFANRLRRAAGRHYRRAYGMGIVEWRILICLGAQSRLSALQISRQTDLNKAQVSRALAVLRRKGWVEIVQAGATSRYGKATLTDTGRALHGRLNQDALARQQRLLAPLAPAEVAAFVAALQTLIDHVPVWEKEAGRGADEAVSLLSGSVAHDDDMST